MDGVMSYYKEKRKASNAAWYKKNKKHRLALAKIWYENNKQRHADAVRKWAANNPEKIKEINKKRHSKHRARRNAESTAYRIKFPNKICLMKSSYRRRNSAIGNADCAKRNARKIRATPLWADLDAIKDVYLEAQYQQMHVDHTVPLKGKNVCGLHVWDNLQLLTEKENCRKGNSWTV